jgi:nucleoside-diphosphate-sugar epimerase/predicted dehydrogenase
MRVGIVGAGDTANGHVRLVRAYTGAQLVGIADTDLVRAERYARDHGIDRACQSVSELLGETRPDVVHVVTPGRSRRTVVAEVLEAGCHAVVAQPLSIDAAGAEELFELAGRRGVQLCPIHDHLFEPCMRRAHDLISSGRLGRVVTVESHYGLDTRVPAFRDYPRPNVLPWPYDLPGGVYQSFLPHPLSVLLELTGPARTVAVEHRSTGVLPQGLPDEIRILVGGERAAGTATLSFAARPHLHLVRVYGTDGTVEVDFNAMTTTVHPAGGLLKAVDRATHNPTDSLQKTRGTFARAFRFRTGRLEPYHGLKAQIHAFYDSIDRGLASPVSRAGAMAVLRTMDAVFAQLRYEPLRHERIAPARTARPGGRRVLVTGGTGFLGRTLVARLVADGYNVRVLARKLSRVEPVWEAGAEIVWGDVADPRSFEDALAGCDAAVHLAAGTSGSERDSETATLQGTRNVLELCGRLGVGRLVYISSCGVYGVADYPDDAVVSETASLERFPERRGTYSASKLEAERYVTQAQERGDVRAVVLRPGTIYGPGGDLFPGLMGFTRGSTYVVIGPKQFVLPYVYVDNLVDAIVLAMRKEEAVGGTFNVVDPETLTKRAYVDGLIRRVDPSARVVYLPYSLLYALAWLQERAFGLMGRRPVLSPYRLVSSQKSVRYDSQHIMTTLGWAQRVPVAEALNRLTAYEEARRAGSSPSTTTPAAQASGRPRKDVEPLSAKPRSAR